MSLDISLETEARLTAKAKEQGLSIDAYLEDLMESPKGVQGLDILKAAGIQPPGAANGEPPQLPVLASRRAWHPSPRRNLRR